jgi:hypothetical protein
MTIVFLTNSIDEIPNEGDHLLPNLWQSLKVCQR